MATAAAAKKRLTLRIRNIRHPMAQCTHNSFSFCITQKNTRRGCSISVCRFLPHCEKGCAGGTLHKSQPTFCRPPPHCLTRPLLTYLWLEQRLNSFRSFMLPVIKALLKYPKTNHTHTASMPSLLLALSNRRPTV